MTSIAGLAVLMLVWPLFGAVKSALRRREALADGRVTP